MGARQSKRSCDITTGKDNAAVVEGGEVAASGGEGKLERIEDVDANLKPQLNGHDRQPQEDNEKETENEKENETVISDKEKQLEERDEQPENEKDNCNEKEIVLSPVVQDEKKPKKDKPKKKWSFRSISFSKKDKTKPSAKKEEPEPEPQPQPQPEQADKQQLIEEVATPPEPKEEVAEVQQEQQAAEKAPDTPVTEPITNGSSSSAPESPKEEDEVEKEQQRVEEPTVDSIPIDGLKIQEPVVEEPVVPEKIVAPEEIAPPAEKPQTEVCVREESAEVVETVEAPPPLPANPPPSSLTIFAETTMAPHLVDAQLPVEASLSSDIAEATIDATVCDTLPIDNVPLASPAQQTVVPQTLVSDESSVQTLAVVSSDQTPDPPSVEEPIVEKEQIEAVASSVVSQVLRESVNKLEEQKDVDSVQKQISDLPSPPVDVSLPAEIVDSLVPEVANLEISSQSANTDSSVPEVVNLEADECENVNSSVPEVTNLETTECKNAESSVPEVANLEIIKSENVDSPVANLETTKCENVDSPISEVANLETTKCENVDSSVPEVTNLEITQCENIDISSVPEVTNLEITLCENIDILPRVEDSVPAVGASESPIPSEPDVSETAFAEPSDSFPPPPESITEISVSESLPPPPSEDSQPDAALNSPTSEIADFPPKDLPSPVKDEPKKEVTPLQNGVSPSPEDTPTKTEESSKVSPSPDTTQMNDVAEVPAVEAPVDSIPTQTCVVAAE